MGRYSCFSVPLTLPLHTRIREPIGLHAWSGTPRPSTKDYGSGPDRVCPVGYFNELTYSLPHPFPGQYV